MVRTQIQLTEKQAQELKRLAAKQGRSMADLIRVSVDKLLAEHDIERARIRERALSVSGRFNSGLKDLAENHDRYLAEILIRDHVR